MSKMSFKCQIFQTRLTFNSVYAKNCDVRLIIILCVISTILPIIKCAKLENPQIRLLINDDDLLQEKSNIHEAAAAVRAHDNSGEHFNLYRSELKRLSYETIHRILRDENEPSYRREDTELRYYQKRSPSYEESHQLIKRSAYYKENEITIHLNHKNLTTFLLTPSLQKQLNTATVLDLSDNYLSQFNISYLYNISSLKSLILRNNSFTFAPLAKETILRSLNLNHNLIKTSSLPSNIYLRNLYLSFNLIENLSSIDFSLLKNLESLDVSHNHLRNSESSFFTQRMHNLKHLNLAFNQLGSIYRETFYNLLSLNTLLLSHNNISDIDYETFLALPNLQYLDLSFNSLRGNSIRALQGITGLVALNIAFNPNIGPYMQEFVASWSLKELDASGTGLCQIPAALAQSVRSLKLTHNWLKIVNCGDLDSYPLLQYLDLSFSHIEYIEDDALGRLEILEILMLDHNLLRKVPYSLPVSLEHLFLQNNGIMEINQQAFQGLTNLKTLDLSHNKLLYLPDIRLPKLQTLNLQSSEITGISQGIIHTLPKLNDLILEDNPIKCVDLLGIAEWASTCRLRNEKEDRDEMEQDKMQNLKNKFERMHNFYEQFELNALYYSNNTLDLKLPKCVEENVNTEQNFLDPFDMKEIEGKRQEALMQSSIAEENSTSNLSIKTFQSNKHLQTERQSELKNKIKTSEYMNATAVVAMKTTSSSTKSKENLKLSTIGYTSAESSSNMTEVVEVVSKRSQEAEQLENVQQKTSMKTFEGTNKTKKWVKEEIPAQNKATSASRPENMEIFTKENKTKDVIATAAALFPQSTTFATPINSETQITTITIPDHTPATTTAFKTTTMTQEDSFKKYQQEGETKGERVNEGTKNKLLEINLLEEKQEQQHEIKTGIATTKEIKPSTTTLSPKSMQRKITSNTNSSISIITVKIPTEITDNLDRKLHESPNAARTTTIKNLNTVFPPTEGEDTENVHADSTTAATVNKTHKIEPQTIAQIATATATATAATTSQTEVVKVRDSASNYHDNDNNRQITKTLNGSKITATSPATTMANNISANSDTTITNSNNNGNHKNNKASDNATMVNVETTTSNIGDRQQQHLMTTKKDVNTKCIMQSNTSECNIRQLQQQHKPDRMPTIESTLEEATDTKTSTVIPTTSSVIPIVAAATIAVTATTPVAVIHKHEPLQLLVKDRHLIGTPLLMHKGENLMVTADELILPTKNNHNAKQDEDNNRDKEQQHNLETNTNATEKNAKNNLESSQITTTTAVETTMTTTLGIPTTILSNIKKETQQPNQPDDPVKPYEFGKYKKSSYNLKTKKPSLIMKKMTIITKQHDQQHDPMQQAVEPLENEVHAKQINNFQYQELKPVTRTHDMTNSETSQHFVKHSTVNTPITKSNNNNKRQALNPIKEPHTFQHEHELLIQQILQDQQAEKFTKTEQWSDLRKAESKENHPGLILLVSSGLFLVLLLGLMHVYRCDMPWRRHSPRHHLRPHQRENHSLEDDSHSFLSYSEGMQKWHHSTHLEALYNSPLHNLHVRELQKTSATEKPTTVKSSASNFNPPHSHTIMLNNTRSLSQSSTTTTSTASPSSSAILDDESFYIEITPDSGQLTHALQSELLPMELLNISQLQVEDYKEPTIADSQTSAEEEKIVHYQQQQQQRHQFQSMHTQHLSSLSSSAAAAAAASADTSSILPCTTTLMRTKPQSQTRKFGLW